MTNAKKEHEQLLNWLEELSSLKDIEEGLRADLVTVIKALKDGVYTKNGFEYPTLIINYDTIDDYLGPNFLIKGGIVLFKDYGKTWALTREELQKE